MSFCPADAEVFKRIVAKDPECSMCFECRSPSPQWCDVNHGIFICLECSGVHRSLGVHLSFVRSSTMDGWTNWRPEKLRQMEVGGNRRARLYFDAHNIPKAPIKARYENEDALRYAAMLEAEAQGKPFNEAAWRPPEWYTRMKEQARIASSSPAGSPQTAQPPSDRFTGMGSAGSGPTPTDGSVANNAYGIGGWYSTLSSGWNAMAQKTSELAQQTDIEGMKTSLAKGWASVSATVSTYAAEVAKGASEPGEDDGLEALRTRARLAAEGQQTAPVEPGRFDHIEHVVTPVSPQPHTAAAVAPGWGARTSSPQGSGQPSPKASPWASATSPTAGASRTSNVVPVRAVGVTTMGSPKASSSSVSASSPKTNGETGVLTGQPVKRKNSDSWDWKDD